MSDAIAEAIREHWGEKCGEFEPECPTCQVWAEFAELSRLSALVAGWRPMDSAPKDGTRFLALQGDRHFDCWWKDAGYGEAYWQDDSDSEPDPTHWRPLPASPVSQLKDTTNADK